jgi:hypothetical protein
MNKNLLKKIGVVALVSGLALVTGNGSKYEFDGNKVRYYNGSGMVIEHKDGDKIKYRQKVFGEDLRSVVVNGDKYKYKNSPVYKEARARYHDLLDKIDSARTAERKAELKAKLDERHSREKEALEIIKK